LPDPRNEILREAIWKSHFVRDPPYWLERGRVTGQSRNDMPVDVRELVAEELVVDLFGFIDLGKGFGDEVYFLHQLNPFRGSQMKQLCCVAFEDYDGPAREELIVMQVGLGEAEVGNEMVFFRPAALAGLASEVTHG
jgi:hypothetical protein